MDILYLLIPLSLALVFVIAALFWWSLKSGQYEDLDGPGYRILMDDDRAAPTAGELSARATPGFGGVKNGNSVEKSDTVDSDQSEPDAK